MSANLKPSANTTVSQSGISDIPWLAEVIRKLSVVQMSIGWFRATYVR